MSDIPMEVDEFNLNIRRQGFLGLFEASPLPNSGRLVFDSSHGLPGLTLQAPQQPQDHSQSPQHDISAFQNNLDPQQSAMWTLNGGQTNQFFFSGPAPSNPYTHQQYSNTVSSNGQYSGPTSPNYSTSSSRQIAPTLSQQASVHPQFPQEISSSLSSHWSTAVQPVDPYRDVPEPFRRSSTLQSDMYEPSSSHPNFFPDFYQKLTAPSRSIPETVGMPPYVCNHCHKPGHIIEDCPERKAKGRTEYVGDKLSNARFFCEFCKNEYISQVFPGKTRACPSCGIENAYTKMWKIPKNSFGQQ